MGGQPGGTELNGTNRIQGRRALITGASSGIGAAVARALAGRGVHLVLAARRVERAHALAAELADRHGVQAESHALDVRDRQAVQALGDRLEGEGLEVDILVNNAGLARGLAPFHEGMLDDYEEMIDTNVKGLILVSRRFLPGMVKRNRGHVVHIGSIAGYQVYPGGNVYNASKFAVRALAEAMNVDLVGTAIRVSSVDPGLVQTEFSQVRFHGDTERAARVYRGYTPLAPEDVADVVCFVLNAPPHVNVADLILLPTDQRSSTVVHKEPV